MGHRPPYVAVASLALTAAYHWRTVRQRIIGGGITNPMHLPSMHSLLDVIETIALEATAATGDPDKDHAARQQFLDKLYAPEPAGAENLNGEKYRPPPPAGFEDPAEIEADFDALTQSLAAR